MSNTVSKPEASLQPSNRTQEVADAYVVLALSSPDGLLSSEDETR